MKLFLQCSLGKSANDDRRKSVSTMKKNVPSERFMIVRYCVRLRHSVKLKPIIRSRSGSQAQLFFRASVFGNMKSNKKDLRSHKT